VPFGSDYQRSLNGGTPSHLLDFWVSSCHQLAGISKQCHVARIASRTQILTACRMSNARRGSHSVEALASAGHILCSELRKTTWMLIADNGATLRLVETRGQRLTCFGLQRYSARNRTRLEMTAVAWRLSLPEVSLNAAPFGVSEAAILRTLALFSLRALLIIGRLFKGPCSPCRPGQPRQQHPLAPLDFARLQARHPSLTSKQHTS